MSDRKNSKYSDDDSTGMTDLQYKGMLLDQLNSWQDVLDLAIKAGDDNIQQVIQKNIDIINKKLRM